MDYILLAGLCHNKLPALRRDSADRAALSSSPLSLPAASCHTQLGRPQTLRPVMMVDRLTPAC